MTFVLQFFAISEFPLKPPAPFPSALPNIFCQKNCQVFQDGKKFIAFTPEPFPLLYLAVSPFFSYLVFLPFTLKNSFSVLSFICILRYTFHFIFHVHVSLSWKKTHFFFLFFGVVFFFLFILKFQVKWTISIPIISLHAHFYDSVEPEFCFYSTEILHFPLHYLIDVSQLSCLFFFILLNSYFAFMFIFPVTWLFSYQNRKAFLFPLCLYFWKPKKLFWILFVRY